MSNAEALDYLDSQLTGAEFDTYRKRAKFLHDCKTKGFARLKKLGRFDGGIKLAENKAAPKHTTREFAEQAADMVNNHGVSISIACEKFGRNPGDLRHHCNRFGIKLNRKMRTWDYDATFKSAQSLINRDGYRLKDTATKLGASPKLLMDVFKAKGYKYNAKTIKIRKIKK